MPRQEDRIARVLHGAGELHEQNGIFGNRQAGFLGVMPVVKPDTQQARRLHRREQLDDLCGLIGHRELIEDITDDLQSLSGRIEARRISRCGWNRDNE